jgi:chromosome segregation ATPase
MAINRANNNGAAQDIEQLKKRHAELDKKKTIAETQLKAANDELERLKKQAKELYGTDDLEELKRKLEGMKAENERRRAEYQKHLDDIEGGLAEVEKQYLAAKGQG